MFSFEGTVTPSVNCQTPKVVLLVALLWLQKRWAAQGYKAQFYYSQLQKQNIQSQNWLIQEQRTQSVNAWDQEQSEHKRRSIFVHPWGWFRWPSVSRHTEDTLAQNRETWAEGQAQTGTVQSSQNWYTGTTNSAGGNNTFSYVELHAVTTISRQAAEARRKWSTATATQKDSSIAAVTVKQWTKLDRKLKRQQTTKVCKLDTWTWQRQEGTGSEYNRELTNLRSAKAKQVTKAQKNKTHKHQGSVQQRYCCTGQHMLGGGATHIASKPDLTLQIVRLLKLPERQITDN